MADSDEALEQAYRLSFGRLVGWLFRRTGDLQLAEDAVASAFASAVGAWRATGIPASPEAWLRVAARNEAMTALRRTARVVVLPAGELPESELAALQAQELQPDPLDERLALLFVCAHPAIDQRMHAPLMLQVVLGVDAARIASVFLVPPSTMGQRLARAKAKIRDAGIRYDVPEPDELASRLGAVLQAIYGAYGLADPMGDATDDVHNGELRGEALRLTQLLTELLPGEAEVWGLRALLLHTESRRAARIVGGVFVELARQDTTLWSRQHRELADDQLRRASALNRIGRFQLEAAISAIHSSRIDGTPTDWRSVVVLYRGLLQIAPSAGATLGAVSALIEVGELAEASTLLGSLPMEAVREHQPYWVCRFRLAQVTGETAEAAAALRTAIGLTTHPAVRAHLVNLAAPGLPLSGE